MSALADNISWIKYTRAVDAVRWDAAAALQGPIAFTFQHLLTVANWNTSTATVGREEHSLRFYVFGSGPRLKWEWIALIVLIILTMVCAYDLYLMVYDQVKLGPWLTVTGMMVLAGHSAPLTVEPDTRYIVGKKSNNDDEL